MTDREGGAGPALPPSTGAAATLEAPAAPAAAAPAPGGPATGRGRRLDYKWLALSVVLFGTIMTILDTTVVNVALRTLQDAFNVSSYNDIAWVATGYLLAQASVIPLAGWATDRYGTKRLYLITLVLFTLASMLCGLAPNLPMLILFRIIQGVGGGMLMPIGMTVILRAVPPRQMGRIMGIFGIPMLMAPAVGPVLGGWLVQDFTWRLIFFINVPIGVVGLVAAWRWLRETPHSRQTRLDLVGLALGTPAVLALMYGVDRSTVDGWGSPLVIGCLACAAVLFAAFVRRQLTTPAPLLQLRLFRDPTFAWSSGLSLILVTAMFGALLLLPLFLQQVHGDTPVQTGLLLMPQAAVAAVAMPIGGMLSDRFGPRPVVLSGLLVLTASSLLLAQLGPDSSVGLLLVALGARGVAMGLAMMPAIAAGLARIPRDLTSRASSITNTVQRAGSSVGIAVLVTVLSAQVGGATREASASSCAPGPAVLASAPAHALVGSAAAGPVDAGRLCEAMAARYQGAASGSGQGQARPQGSGDAAFDAFAKRYADAALSIAFDRTFVVTAVLTLLGVVPALFLRRPDRGSSDAPAAGLAA